MKVVVLIGAPGSGKGTLASCLAERFPVCHVSSGDLLRAAVKQADTPAAIVAAETMRKGELVADSVVSALVFEKLQRCAPDDVVLLDGFPRNEKQAAALDAEAAKVGARVKVVVWLDVSEAVLIARLAGRRVCSACAAGYHAETMKPRVDGICDICGAALVMREDDRPERIANRLVVFRKKTASLIGWYEAQGLLLRVDGNGGTYAVVDQVAEAVMA